MLESNDEKLFQIADEFGIGKGINSDEQIKMLNQLNNYPREDAVKLLNFFVTHENNSKVLIHIIKLIDKYRDKSSSGVLLDLLLLRDKRLDNLINPDDNLKIRCMIATVLGNLKDQSAVIPILYVLNNKDEDYKLRLSAAEALGRIGDRFAVAPLIEVVADENEKSIYLRESAAKALGMLGDISAVETLVKILETKKGIVDKFTFLKERIIQTIGKIGFRDDRTIKALNNALMDESPQVRMEAIEALSEINDDRIICMIEKMINDEDEDVGRCAVNVLYELNGENYAIDLLKRNDLPGWCRDEIESILEDTEEDESDE